MSPLNITQPLGIMVYNGYYKVMSNIPKMGQLPTPVERTPSPTFGAFGGHLEHSPAHFQDHGNAHHAIPE